MWQMKVTDSTYDWLTWGLMDCPSGRIPPDVHARMEADRERAASLQVAAARLRIGWSYDRTLRKRSARAGVRLHSTWRRVASFTIDDQRVYLEACGGMGTGPGFGFKDVRIYLDDVLVGRTWRGGCALGFGGGSAPAVALLRNGSAIRVTITGSSSADREDVDLLGHIDLNVVLDVLTQLPPPRGLNARGRRAINRRGAVSPPGGAR
jgi:hypothetical protein